MSSVRWAPDANKEEVATNWPFEDVGWREHYIASESERVWLGAAPISNVFFASA